MIDISHKSVGRNDWFKAYFPCESAATGYFKKRTYACLRLR